MGRRFLFVCVMIVLSAILRTCIASLQSPIWAQSGHDAQHTGRSPYVGSGVGGLLWSFATGSSIQCSPTIGSDGTIYVGSDKTLKDLRLQVSTVR